MTLGFVVAAAQLSLTSILVKPKRLIGPFAAQVTLREVHTDNLQVTNHPVDQGAQISDHAFKLPARLDIECGYSDSPSTSGFIDGVLNGIQSTVTGNSIEQVKDVYAKFLALQESRQLIDVFTRKRTYKNMLIVTLGTSTDARTENAMVLHLSLQQILIVSTTEVTLSTEADTKADPGSNQPVTGTGVKQLIPGERYSVNGGP